MVPVGTEVTVAILNVKGKTDSMCAVGRQMDKEARCLRALRQESGKVASKDTLR